GGIAGETCFPPRTGAAGGGFAVMLRPGRIALNAFLVAALVFMVAPIAIVVVESFNSSAFGQWPPPGFSTRWYANLFHGGGFGSPTIRSLEIAVLATAGSLVAGTFTALA